MKHKSLILFGLAAWIGLLIGQGITGTWQANIIKWHTANTITTQMDTVLFKETGATQRRVSTNGVAADTLTYITGTAIDTSRVYQVEGFMTFTILLDDTSAANDSAAQEIKIYTASLNDFATGQIPAFADFVLADSVTVSTQVATDWKYTASPVPVKQFFYLTTQGVTGNKLTSAVANKTTVSKWRR